MWTFKIRAGREVPRRQADDGGGRRGDVQPARRPGQRLQRAVGVHAACCPRAARRRSTTRRSMFKLDAPNGNFPYLVSSDNYNAIILPEGLRPGDLEKTFMGTGPWKLEKYTPNVGVTYTQEPDYWDTTRKPLPDRNEIKFYEKEQAADPGAPGRRGRRRSRSSRSSNGKALLNDPNITCIELRVVAAPPDAHAHRQGAVQRQARAPGDGAAARPRRRSSRACSRARPTSATTARSRRCSRRPTQSVPQRKQDIEKAKALLAEAGVSDGFSVELRHVARRSRSASSPQLVQNDAKAAGINVKLNITDAGTLLRRRRRSASRRGWTRRWASPTTATAACRTCSSARRSRATAPGTRRTSRTGRTTAWSAEYIAALDIQRAAGGGEEDPGAAARRDADHLPLLLLLPDGDQAARSAASR